MIRCAVVAVMLVAGCSEDLPTDECGGLDYHPVVHTRTLDQLPMLVPSVTLSPYDPLDPGDLEARRITISLPYGMPFAARGHAPIQDSPGGDLYCAEIDPQLSATIAGVAGDFESDGGWTCLGTGGPSCAVPRVIIDVPGSLHPADATLELTSGGFAHSYAFGDTLAARSLEVVGGPPSATQPVTVRVSPASDLDSYQLEAIQFLVSDQSGWALPPSEITRSGDTLTFTPPMAHTGPGRLVVRYQGHLASGADVLLGASASVTFAP